MSETLDTLESAARFLYEQIARYRALAAEAPKDDRERALLAPFAAMGGDWAMPAYHDLEADVVVWGPSAGRYVTAGDVRAARRYLDGGAADEPDYRPALAAPPVPDGATLHDMDGHEECASDNCEVTRLCPRTSEPQFAPPSPAGDEREREARTTQISRIVLRLPRMLTDADDYSWVPLGDVLAAVLNPDAAEQAWPEDGKRMEFTTLRDLAAPPPDGLREALYSHHQLQAELRGWPIPFAPCTCHDFPPHQHEHAASQPPPDGLTEPVYIVFDGPASHESGRFVEVENEAGGAGPSNAKWEQHPTAPGLWRLGPFLAHTERSTPDD